MSNDTRDRSLFRVDYIIIRRKMAQRKRWWEGYKNMSLTSLMNSRHNYCKILRIFSSAMNDSTRAFVLPVANVHVVPAATTLWMASLIYRADVVDAWLQLSFASVCPSVCSHFTDKAAENISSGKNTTLTDWWISFNVFSKIAVHASKKSRKNTMAMAPRKFDVVRRRNAAPGYTRGP